MERGDCEKLGRSMEVETRIEFCAALKHNDTVGYDVYEKDEDGDFRMVAFTGMILWRRLL